MTKYLNLIQYFIYAFFFALAISPFIISLIKREKVKQIILHYVESHKLKSGTPTMGGVIFIVAISILSFICLSKVSFYAKLTIMIFLAYGFVGFLDDFIKVKCKRNLGLRPYQKIIFQLSISILVGFIVYKTNLAGNIIIPFSNKIVDIGWWIIPLVAIIYLATTNSVNLTDGLDGLAASSTLFYLLSFLILLLIFIENNIIIPNIVVDELDNISVVCSVSCGALLSFLVFNCFPAKIFMGDTGSLALGSLVSSVAVFSGLELYVPILGIVFVASSVSVILQVAYYKLTKKRIFLMAPLHHHFEKKGVHEVRITICYSLVTIFAGVVTILLNIL